MSEFAPSIENRLQIYTDLGFEMLRDAQPDRYKNSYVQFLDDTTAMTVRLSRQELFLSLRSDHIHHGLFISPDSAKLLRYSVTRTERSVPLTDESLDVFQQVFTRSAAAFGLHNYIERLLPKTSEFAGQVQLAAYDLAPPMDQVGDEILELEQMVSDVYVRAEHPPQLLAVPRTAPQEPREDVLLAS